MSSLLTLLRATRAKADQLQFLFSELETAHQRALAADGAKTRFLATMSHELRTPLNAILGYAELIEEMFGQDNASLRGDTQKIVVAGRHLLEMINGILDYSKLEADQLGIDPAWFEIAPWAHDVVDVLRPLAAQNGNQLVLDVAGDIPQACTDAFRLRQCLFNLAGNACKFTTDGLIAISISVDAGALHVKVSDTGIGISPEQQERLFQPFSQADASISRRFGGTGLGLSITRKIAELLGGRVSVDSKVGMGSTFELVVPLRLAAAEDVCDAPPAHIARMAQAG